MGNHGTFFKTRPNASKGFFVCSTVSGSEVGVGQGQRSYGIKYAYEHQMSQGNSQSTGLESYKLCCLIRPSQGWAWWLFLKETIWKFKVFTLLPENIALCSVSAIKMDFWNPSCKLCIIYIMFRVYADLEFGYVNAQKHIFANKHLQMFQDLNDVLNAQWC